MKSLKRWTRSAVAVKSPRQRTFWWTASGLIDAIQHDALNDYAAKQILPASISSHGALLKVRKRWRRPFTARYPLFPAKSQPSVDSVKQIRESFVLDELTSSVSIEQGDAASAQKVARECKELLNQAKEAWIRYTGGNADRLQSLRELLSQLRDASEGLQIAGLSAMFHALANAIDAVLQPSSCRNRQQWTLPLPSLLEGIYDRRNSYLPFCRLQLDCDDQAPDRADQSILLLPGICPDLPQLDQLSRDAGENAAIAADARSAGQPAAHRTGAGCVLPRQQQTRRIARLG